MINVSGSTKAGLIQNYTVSKSKNMIKEKNSQAKEIEKIKPVDLKGLVIKDDPSKELKLKPSLEPCVECESIKITRPRDISSETFMSRLNLIKTSLEKVNRMNLTYGERMNFLRNEGIRWVEDIRANDPDMFVEWLKSNKENIMNGRSDLANLPSDFTMRDYYYYTKESFSAKV